MLSFEERRLLEELVVRPVADTGSTDLLIDSIPADIRKAFVPGGNFLLLVRRAIKLCEEDGYRTSPSSLSSFLRHMADVSIDSRAILLEYSSRLARQPATNANPYLDMVVHQHTPFLDRTDLRNALRRTVSGPYDQILLINGPRRSGKSFTARLIDHISRHIPGIEHCIVKTPNGSEAPSALDVAKDMMACLGARSENLPPQLTNGKRWPRELANVVAVELKAHTQAQSGTWLTVLDLSSDGRIEPDVTGFVHQLATSLMTGIDRDRHRLVLMDFPEDDLEGLDMHVQSVWFDELSSEEMREELERMFRALGREDDAKDLADGILRATPNHNIGDIGRSSAAVVRRLYS
ncbi:hypothetical protein [Rhizobium leguminosarum]|uniref:hypothetical protein n=1 Tax=Rhizobium leguminosarum TaxID=384 RepID=UPI001C9396D7|nr:hypothetical protein [Rhizobium leguminosarum]MBY5515662.1 hypothetical protein [Rhizobium leguminosarum]